MAGEQREIGRSEVRKPGTQSAMGGPGWGEGGAPLPQLETFPSGPEPGSPGSTIHPVRVSAPPWTTPSSAGDTLIETC